ncbi:MAG: hypothetical protein AB2L20_07135 [Mangrovibacterium sp.]
MKNIENQCHVGFDSRPGYKKPPQNQQIGEVFVQNKTPTKGKFQKTDQKNG